MCWPRNAARSRAVAGPPSHGEPPTPRTGGSAYLLTGRRWRYNGGVFLQERDSLGWVLKALREAGGTLVREFYDLDEDSLCQRPNDDDWSLKEIAAHLRDNEQLAVKQIAAFVERGGARLPAWDVEILPQERDYRSSDIDELLSELRMLRRQTTHLLWGVSTYEWESAADHPYRGKVTLEEIARELAQHDLEHLWQVRRLKTELDAD